MRVIIFSTAYLPHVGGAEIAVKEITDRIDDISFTMITAKLDPALPDREKVGNVDVCRIGKGDRWDKFRLFFAGVSKAKELGQFDVVWSIMASYSGFAALKYKNKRPDTKFLLTLQEGDSKAHIYKHVWFVWPYFKQIFKKADKVQAISNYLANWAKEMGAKSPSKVIPNGINTLVFERESVSSNKKIVFTTSRLVKKNGVGDLIESLMHLPQDVVLKIAGDGELRADLESLVQKRGLESRVSFLGTVEQIDLVGHLNAAKVFCRPSLSEGLGIAFLEAMSMNVPVIATDVGGITDFLKDGKTGWFCKVGDPKNIAEKISYVLDEANKENVARVVSAAKLMVKEDYDWDKISKNIRKLFQDLL